MRLLAVAMSEPRDATSLADLWEQDRDVRHFLRGEDALIRWPKASAVGIVNLATLGLNHKVLSLVAEWHCPRAVKLGPPSVKHLKAEARVWSTQPETCKSSTQHFGEYGEGLWPLPKGEEGSFHGLFAA